MYCFPSAECADKYAEYAKQYTRKLVIWQYGNMTIWQYAKLTHTPFPYAEYADKYAQCAV
jgi:hypothetical protein